MSTETHAPATLAKRSKLNYLSVLITCVTSAFLTASVVLILQYKKGVPFSLTLSLLLAAAVALVLPFLAAFMYGKIKTDTRYGRYGAFILANLAISILTGVLIF